MATPHEMAQALITQKTAIESEIQTHITILASNKVDMQTPLVDREGFPRDDIDIYAVRRARVRIIELRNDLKGVMDALGKALERVFDPSLAPKTNGTTTTEEEKVDPLRPFAEVSGVAPGSPAAEAGLARGDLVVKFGALDQTAFKDGLQPLAGYVSENENRTITIRVLRNGQTTFLTFTPRKDWGGRGMLGCHIVPYTAPPPPSVAS